MTDFTMFELLQPVKYHTTKGYISFMCESYVSICFIDRPDPTCRWGRYKTNLVVYSNYWHEIQSCLPKEQEKFEIAPRSSILELGRREFVGAAY